MRWKNKFPKENRYYETDNGILYCGDCLEIMKEFPKESIDLILTDPPYGVNFNNNKSYNDDKNYVFKIYNNWFEEWKKILKKNSHLYIFVPTLEIDKWVSIFKKYFIFKNLLAFQSYNTNKYFKDNFSFDLQLIIYGYKNKGKRLNKVDWIPTSKVWLNDKRNKKKNKFTYKYPSFNKFYKANEKSNGYKKKEHENVKSLKLVKKFILLSSNDFDIVFDSFMGSGTTAIAAEQLNRRWIGIELNKDYCEIAKRRINENI